MFTFNNTPATGNALLVEHAAPSIEEIIAQATAAGSHFFSPTMMEAFNSEVYPQVFAGPCGVYFVSSEVCPIKGLRFTVREFLQHSKRNVGHIRSTGSRTSLLADAFTAAADFAAEGAPF